MTALAGPPVAADLDPETARPFRITVTRSVRWPEGSPCPGATVLGWAEGPDARQVAATARAFIEATGRQPRDLPGWTAAGERA